MNQTNIDTLFQALAPVGDRTSSTARTSGYTAGFDDHLSQASATVVDVVRPSSRSDTASSYSTSDDSRTPSGSNSTSADSTSSDQDGAGQTICPPPQKPVEESDDIYTAADNDDADENDADTSHDEEASALTGTAQTTGKVAPQKPEAKSQKSEREVHAHSKNGIPTDEPAKRHAKRAATADDASPQSDAQASVSNAKLIDADDLEEASVDKTADTAAKPEQTGQDAAPTKQATKTGRANAAHAGSGADDSAHAAQQAKGSTSADASGATAHTQATASANAATAPAADTDASEDDEPRRGAKTTARANSRGDVPTPVNKSDVTAIANGIAANIADVATNGKAANDAGDQPAKPVAVRADSAIASLGRATRATTDIHRGGRSANANEAPRVDPARFVGRVAKAFQTANERGGTLQLRLSPPELGALKIQLTVKDGVMSATLETDNAGARRVLLDHLPALRDRLAEQNIRVDRFDVDVRQENDGGQANPRGLHQQPHQQQPDNAGSRRPAATLPAPETVQSELPSALPRISSTGINLVV